MIASFVRDNHSDIRLVPVFRSPPVFHIHILLRGICWETKAGVNDRDDDVPVHVTLRCTVMILEKPLKYFLFYFIFFKLSCSK